MKTIIAIIALTSALAHADGNSCIVPAPTAVPTADRVLVLLPKDGGVINLSDGGTTTGCAISAYGTGGTATPGVYSIGNVKCATAASMGQQAFANDNGWADGGAP